MMNKPKWWAFCCLLLINLLSRDISCEELPIITPEHNVQIEKTEEIDGSKPHWKEMWDRARKLVRTKNLDAAQLTYSELLKRKPNIVEARWEYFKLLTQRGELIEATKILDGLLELEPENLEYIIAGGKTALQNSLYAKAVKFFGQAYEMDPFGEYSDSALWGLIQSFLAQDNQFGAILLLEQNLLRKPEDKFTLEKLAQLYAGRGNLEKAKYLYSRLISRFPGNKRYFFEAGKLYTVSENNEVAEGYWKKYLSYDEGFLPFHKNLADFYLNRGQYQQAVPHLVKLYKGDSLSLKLARQIADIFYENLNRPDKALLYYEQCAKEQAGNSKLNQRIETIRDKLAHQYLPIVENNATERLWADLDLITLNKKVLFEKMALMLNKDGKTELEADVLLILHNNYQHDLSAALRLATIYKNMGNFNSALELLEKITLAEDTDKGFLLVKAEVEMGLGREIDALETYKEYIRYKNGNIKAVQKTVELAGNLGLVNDFFEIWKRIPKKSKSGKNAVDLRLTYVGALRKNGLFTHAENEYKDILSDIVEDEKQYVDVNFQMADSLLEQNLIFSSEQVVRQILARDKEVARAIEKLFEISLVENQLERAESWLYLLEGRLKEEGTDDTHRLSFLKLDLLLAENEFDDARELLDDIKAKSRKNVSSDFLLQTIEIYDARIKYYTLQFSELLRKLDTLSVKYPELQEIIVLRDLVQFNNTTSSERLREEFENGSVSLLELLDRASFYTFYRSFHRALNALDLVLDSLPESQLARIEKIKTLISISRYEDALALLNDIAMQHPDQDYFANLRLELEFKSGKFQKIVERVVQTDTPKEKTEYKEEENGGEVNFWKKLLLARALWADNKRDEAIKVYDSLLSAPVDTMFLEKMEVEKINFHLPPLKKSFWNVITFTNPSEPDPITTVMDPKFVAQNRGKPVDDIAASMYGKYRWQKLIRKELSARKAVEQRDYYRAEKEYLSLLKEEKSEESLFDLAGIYNRLGLYGKEGELYEIMKSKSPLYPGLDEYINANVLKRQPRISARFFSELRRGRDNYINLKKKGIGVEGWFTPTYDQEISLSVFQNNYESYNLPTESKAHRIAATYSTYFEDSFDLNISFGTNQPTSNGTNEGLFKFEIKGRLNKSIDVYGRFEQDLVEDTIQSVLDSIIYQDIEAGVKYDLFPRLFVGFDYRYRLYSDNNQQNRYKIWSTYHLFGEQNQFKIKYSYEDIRNSDENLIEDGEIRNDSQPVDRVYWSPEHYWQHLFTFHFNHLFDSSQRVDSPLSYISFDYSLGFEEDSDLSHEFDMNIFLEINRHFLLKGNLKNHNGDNYEETEAGFSLIYRW